MALMQKQSYNMKSPALQSLLIMMLNMHLDGGTGEQGSSSSSTARVTLVWTPCPNCMFDSHYQEWAKT